MTKTIVFVLMGALALGACKRGGSAAGGVAPRGGAAVQAAPLAPGAELVDRVVAVVGDSIVLQLDLEEGILALQSAGQPVPAAGDSAGRAALKKQLLESKISEMLLLQAAERDTVEADEGNVETAVQNDLATRIKTFGSQEAFEAALRRENLTAMQYREMRAREFRRTALIQKYLGQVERTRRSPSVTEEEMRAYFNAQKARLGERPAMITFVQALVVPHASDTARANARQQALELLTKVRAGEDFATLAKRYSADPGSKERGGDLGWFRRESMMAAFSDAAYNLRPGEVSDIVETPFGFHVIKLEKIRAAERQARHILIQPTMTSADAQRTRALADSLYAKVQAGASLDSLSKIYFDPAEQPKVGPYPKDRLPEPYKTAMANVTTGQVVGPLPLPAELPGAEKYAVTKVIEVSQAGEYTMEDPIIRAQVREQLQRQKLVTELVEELKKRNYIDIRL